MSLLDEYTTTEEIATVSKELKWDRAVYLSPNAICFLASLLEAYCPEPWESDMTREIKHRLEAAR